MSEFKETVTTKKDSGLDESGREVSQQTRRVDTEAKADGKSVASNIIWFLLGVVEILLAFRFILKLFGANPDSGFVAFIYSASGALTAPFDNIFNVASTSAGEIKSVFEPSILVAAVVYAIVAWGIVKVVNINRADRV